MTHAVLAFEYYVEGSWFTLLELKKALRRPRDELRHLTKATARKFPNSVGAIASASAYSSSPFERRNLADQAMSVDPNDPLSLALLAEVRRKEGRADEARDLADRARHLAPTNLTVLRAAARAFVDAKDLASLSELAHLERGRRMVRWAIRISIVNDLKTLSLTIRERDGLGVRLPLTFDEQRDFLDNPSGVLEGWRSTFTYAALNYSKSSRPESKLSVRAESSPPRVLIIADNWNFSFDLLHDLESRLGFEVRTLSTRDLDSRNRPQTESLLIESVLRELAGDELALPDFPDSVLQDLAWCDVVFVEWCNYSALWASRYVRSRKPMMIRLHSYEAFRSFPHLVDWNQVDTLVTVSPNVRRLVSESIHPEAYGVKMRTIPNVNDLGAYARPKVEGSSRTLALVGYGNSNKNPIMAVRILARFLDKNDGWRLLLVGHPFPESLPNPWEENYRREFETMAGAPDLSPHIELVPFTDDLPDVFTRVGYILSTSAREGTHEAVLQGMASGAVPIVRDWPFFAAQGGARSHYPQEAIFSEVTEAVDMITRIDNGMDRDRVGRESMREAMKRDSEFVLPKIGEEISDLARRTVRP